MAESKDFLQELTDLEEANLKLSNLRDETNDTLQKLMEELTFKSSEIVRKGSLVIDKLRSPTVPLMSNYLKLEANIEKLKKSLQEDKANFEKCALDLKRENDTLQKNGEDDIARLLAEITRRKKELKECVATQEREEKELLEEICLVGENAPNETPLAKQAADYKTKIAASKNTIQILNKEIKKVNAELQREKEFDKKKPTKPTPAANPVGPISGSTRSVPVIKQPRNKNVPPLLQIGINSVPNTSTGNAPTEPKKRKLFNPNDLSYLEDLFEEK